METIEYILPVHLVTAAVNDDWTGIEDEEEQEFKNWAEQQRKELFSKCFIICAPDGPPTFAAHNDFNDMAGNVHKTLVLTEPLKIGGKLVKDMYPPYTDATGRVKMMSYRNNQMGYGYTKEGTFCLFTTTQPISATIRSILFESNDPEEVEREFLREQRNLPRHPGQPFTRE